MFSQYNVTSIDNKSIKAICEAGEYMTDIVCTKSNGELLVRECVSTKILPRPLTGKMLDISRTYWLRRGVKDWGIVTDATEE